MKNKDIKAPLLSGVTALLLVSMVGILTGCWKHGMASPDWDASDRDAAVAALEAGDCNKVWRLVWLPAKQGNTDARLLLADAIYAQGLTPPGTEGDALAQLRSAITVYAEIARTGDPHAIEMLSALLNTDFFAEANGKGLVKCLEESSDRNACLGDALAVGIFPSFSQWVSEIDSIGQEAGGGGAKCTRMQEDRVLTDEDFDVRPINAQ